MRAPRRPVHEPPLNCDFCHFRCRLPRGRTGRCGVRQNQGGRIVTLSRDLAVSLAIDPIEKKPLYHVQPGSRSLSVALFGCNLRCRFCQNASISQPGNRERASGYQLEPAGLALRMEQAGLKSVSFTYSEPTVWQDWMLDAAFAVKARGGRCYMVTNGSFTPESRGRFWGLIDAYNIDVKGDDAFYREYCRGYLEPVLDNVAALCREPAVLVEVCTLLIEGIHTVDGIIRLGKELAAAGLKIWHLSRFHPAWKMRDHPPTSQEFLDQVLEALRDTVDIPFIYPGNSPRVTETACPACGRLLIARDTDWPGRLVVAGNRCPDCGLVFPLLT